MKGTVLENVQTVCLKESCSRDHVFIALLPDMMVMITVSIQIYN